MAAPTNEATWGYAMHVYLGIMKNCNHYMTPDEQLVMSFVYNRTFGFKKRIERIPIRHFTDGVVSREGEIIATRVGISKTNILRALKHLKAKGLLLAYQDSEGGSNYFEIPAPDTIDHETVCNYIRAEQNDDIVRKLIAIDTPRVLGPTVDQGVVHQWTN